MATIMTLLNEAQLPDSPSARLDAELLLAAGRRDEAGSFLHAAIEQLGALRSTPARQALMRRAQEQLEAAAGRPAG